MDGTVYGAYPSGGFAPPVQTGRTGGQTGGFWAGLKAFGQDPARMQIVFGKLAEAIAEKDTWQSRMGRAFAGLGAGRKMATAMERARGEERERWSRLFKTLAGERPELTESDLMSMGTLEAPSTMPTGFGGAYGIMPSGFGQPNILQRHLGGYGGGRAYSTM